MTRLFFILLLFQILFSLDLRSQSEKEPIISAKQKLFVHTDRDYYSSGGQMFYKIYVSSNSGKLSSQKSEQLYLDVINSKGEIVQSQVVLVKQGTAHGHLQIDGGLPSGKYVVRAYTDLIVTDIQQYFRKIIHLSGIVPYQEEGEKTVNDTIYVNLLPEGGNLVHGLKNRISFIAKNSEGLPFQTKFLSNYGDDQISLETNTNGMGSIELIPEKNKLFKIEYSAPVKYNWPVVLNNGVSIKIEPTVDNLQIKLIKNTAAEVKLLIHQNNKVIVNENIIDNNYSNNYEWTNLPSGILHCTILDESNDPLAERLFFNYNGIDNYNIDIATNKEELGRREHVRLQIDSYDDDGEVLEGDLSLSIVDEYIAPAILNNSNIQSNYYLSSRLNNIIINPNQYFNWDDDKITEKLDLLLRVYGWRKFKLIKNNDQNIGINILGLITKKNRPNDGVKAHGLISFLNGNMQTLPFVTDASGNLNISNLEFYGNQDIMIQAEQYNKKKKTFDGDEIKMSGNRNVDITLLGDSPELASPLDLGLFYRNRIVDDQSSIVAATESVLQDENDVTDVAMSIDLDEITITKEKINEVIASYRPSMVYSDANDRIITTDVQNIGQYRDVYDLLRGRVTGLILDGPDEGMLAKHKVILRGYTAGGLLTSDAASFFVNGNYVPQIQVEAIDPVDIAFVDVVKSLHQLAAYGEAGVNGIVFIYLKPPGLRVAKKPRTYNGILSTTIQGYAESRQFYAPNYSESNTETFDNRVTIHWEPQIQIDDSGIAYIDFYTADKSTIYHVDIQGVAISGLPISANATIIVR